MKRLYIVGLLIVSMMAFTIFTADVVRAADTGIIVGTVRVNGVAEDGVTVTTNTGGIAMTVGGGHYVMLVPAGSGVVVIEKNIKKVWWWCGLCTSSQSYSLTGGQEITKDFNIACTRCD